MSQGLFVLGVDEGVGTSLVARGLLLAIARRGLRAIPFRPVELACVPLADTQAALPVEGLPGLADPETRQALARLSTIGGPPPAGTFSQVPPEQLHPAGTAALLAATGLDLPLALLNPFRYSGELDPATEARLADRPILPEQVIECAGELSEQADLLIADGCGGPLAPFGPSLVQLDLVEQLGMTVVLVAASAPGTVSRCLLALEALAQRQLPLGGLCLNRLRPGHHPEEAAYPLLIESFAGDVVRGVLPHFSPDQLSNNEYIADRFIVHVDIDHMLI